MFEQVFKCSLSPKCGGKCMQLVHIATKTNTLYQLWFYVKY